LPDVDQKNINLLILNKFKILLSTGSFRPFWAIPEARVFEALVYLLSRCFTHEEKNHGKAAFNCQTGAI
jgi:hypothetical protein